MENPCGEVLKPVERTKEQTADYILFLEKSKNDAEYGNAILRSKLTEAIQINHDLIKKAQALQDHFRLTLDVNEHLKAQNDKLINRLKRKVFKKKK